MDLYSAAATTIPVLLIASLVGLKLKPGRGPRWFLRGLVHLGHGGLVAAITSLTFSIDTAFSRLFVGFAMIVAVSGVSIQIRWSVKEAGADEAESTPAA